MDFNHWHFQSLGSLPRRRYEIKHERDDRVDGHQLDAFVPVGLAIAADQRADQHAHEQGTGLGAVEGKFKRLRRDEVTEQDER